MARILTKLALKSSRNRLASQKNSNLLLLEGECLVPSGECLEGRRGLGGAEDFGVGCAGFHVRETIVVEGDLVAAGLFGVVHRFIGLD